MAGLPTQRVEPIHELEFATFRSLPVRSHEEGSLPVVTHFSQLVS